MGTEVYKMGRKPIEMIGVKFGRWTVIERAGSDKDSKPMWLCECVCGNRKIINGAALRRGDSKSCGCISKEIFTKHGMYKSRLNKTYRGMKQRCYNPKNTRYEYYGGRGIVMCQEWLGENGFINFMNWALKSGYTDELSIDRINNDGIYEPSNCQWVNEESQCRNRRIKSNNKTGVSGVFPRGSKWRVHIRVNGKNLNVGTFDNFDDASLARKNAEAKYWGGGDNNDRNVK
jgi:hypothetical protein